MARTYSEVEQALNSEIRSAEAEYGGPDSEFIEARAVRRVIRDILSLAPDSPLPGTTQERELLEKVVFLMSLKSRKWLSEAQVAFPHAELRKERKCSDAELKSRVWDRVVDGPERKGRQDGLVAVGNHLVLRRHFMTLLANCILDDERERYPQFLNLVDTTPSELGECGDLKAGLDANAWYLFRYCSEVIRSYERSSRIILPDASDPLASFEISILMKQQAQRLHLFRAKVDESPWCNWMRLTDPSKDSLFAKLFVHAALNRMMLEFWAFEGRSKQALLTQEPLVRELEVTSPEGILPLLKRHAGNDSIDMKGFINDALRLSISSEGGSRKSLTQNVLERIAAQVDAVMASAESPEFEAEAEVNRLMQKYSMPASALLHLALAWSYVHGTKLVDDDPRLHASEVAPISRRSKLVLHGQGMVTLRRLLVTLLNSFQWFRPSAARLLLHEEYYSTVRMTVLRVLEQDFKPTSLAQWNLPEYEALPAE